MAYLNESHPEVFFTVPRPGGIANIKPVEFLGPRVEAKTSKTTLASRRSIRSSRSLRSRGSISKSGFPVDNYFQVPAGVTSREYRVSAAMISSPWALFDSSFEDFPKPPNPAQDVIDMLAITISTIMVLASGGEVPDEHHKWALSYLENITDENGNNPPNVTGIINHLKNRNLGLESFNNHDGVARKETEEEGEGEGEEETGG